MGDPRAPLTIMNPTKSCPECGKPLPAGSDVCPACLMAQAIASRTFDDEKGPREIPPPPAPEEIADKFPQFEILECLGRGGMGVVYKARQKSLNRLVAIKILAPERERDARFAERFAKEAEMLAKLSHPHIVTIHDFGETGGLYYLVMEFINGVNLRDLLRDGKMAPEQALAIVPPICDALQFAHEHGIVHRDIKPENILLDREGRVKIADFGIATLAGDAAERAGTPDYMAPEQNGGAKIIDHRADIYALGVVLYEMLTGERPTTTPVAPSRRVQIDVRLDEVVMKALEGQPDRRYQTAADFRTVVETAVRANPPVPPGEWQLRCTTCQSARSLASAGAIRMGAASVGKRTLAWCRSCGGLRFAAIEKAGETRAGSTTADPQSNHKSWTGLLLHFTPALLLVAAWWASGLERGAVLILSVLVTAMLVLKAVVRSKPVPITADTPARWALGLFLAGIFGTPLLLSFTTKEEGVLLAGAACLLASLVLAIVSWRTLLGKTLALIWAGIFTIAAVMVIIYQLRMVKVRDEALASAQHNSQQLEDAARRAEEGNWTGRQDSPFENRSLHEPVTIDGKGTYPTISAALADAPPGAVLRLAAGIYAERIVIRKPVTLIGAGWENTRLQVQGPYLAESREYEKPEMTPEVMEPAVKIETKSRVNLEGISFSMSGTPSEGALAETSLISADKCQLSLKDCALVGSVGNGIEAKNANLEMNGCLIAAAWNTGIVLGDSCSAEIQNCTVRNCYYAGISVLPRSNPVTIANCDISGAAWHGIRYDNCSPTIAGNFIHNNARSGIYLSGDTAGEITGNVFVRNEMNGVSCWFESRDKIERNIFAANLRESIQLSGMVSSQIRGNVFSGKGISQGLINEEHLAAKTYGTPVVQRNVFWNIQQPWMKGTEAVTLPEGNRMEDPRLGEDYGLPADSSLRPLGIGPEKIPAPRPAFAIQPEETAIIPDGETRDSNAWKQPK